MDAVSEFVLEVAVQKALIEILPIVVIDLETGDVIYVNRQALAVFGYDDVTELLGQKVEVLIPESLRESHVHYREIFRQNPLMRVIGRGGQLLGQRKNDTVFGVQIGITAVSDVMNRDVGIAFVVPIEHAQAVGGPSESTPSADEGQ